MSNVLVCGVCEQTSDAFKCASCVDHIASEVAGAIMWAQKEVKEVENRLNQQLQIRSPLQELQIEVDRARTQLQVLTSAVEHEQRLLEDDKYTHKCLDEKLEILLKQLHNMPEMYVIKVDDGKEDSEKLRKAQCMLVDRLFTSLRVKRRSHQSCSILGIEVPDELEIREDEDLSTVLGLIAVVVSMLSRYLFVPLTVHFGWESLSRTYILQYADSFRYPRDAQHVDTSCEKEQRYNLYQDLHDDDNLYQAVSILDRCVLKLCHHVGVPNDLLGSMHILPNLLALYSSLTTTGFIPPPRPPLDHTDDFDNDQNLECEFIIPDLNEIPETGSINDVEKSSINILGYKMWNPFE